MRKGISTEMFDKIPVISRKGATQLQLNRINLFASNWSNIHTPNRTGTHSYGNSFVFVHKLKITTGPFLPEARHPHDSHLQILRQY